MNIIIGIILIAIMVLYHVAPLYLVYQLYVRFATYKEPRLSIGGVIGYFLLWFFIGFIAVPMFFWTPFPFFDVVPVLLFGWTVGLWRFFSGFQFEPIAVVAGAISLTLFFITLHFLLRSILKPYGRTWTFRQSSYIGGIILAAAVSGIVLLAGIHEVYWAATSKEPWLNTGKEVRRAQASSNLKQIGLGVHVFNDAYSHLPLGGTFLPDGRLGHSWATQLLPFIEHQAIYNMIALDKPWTAPENRAAFETRINYLASNVVSRSEQYNAAGYALNFYAVNERVLPVGERVTFDSITGGTSNTILLGEVKDNVRAWGDPINGRDPALGINKSPFGFGGNFAGGAIIGLCDGTVRFMTDNTDPEVLRKLANPDEDGSEEVKEL